MCVSAFVDEEGEGEVITSCILYVSLCGRALLSPLCAALASMQRELDEGHVRFRDSGQQREVLTRAADQQYFVKEVSS